MSDVPLSLPIFIPVVCVTAFIACTLVAWCIKRRLSSHIIHHRVFTLDTIPHVTSCTVIDIEIEAERRRTMSLAEEMDRADRERATTKAKERELEEKTKQADALYNQEKERSQHELDAYRRELLTDSTLLPHISPTLPSTSPIIRPIDRTTDSTGTHRFEFSPDGVLIITPVLSSTSTTISTPVSPPSDTQHVHPLLRRITPEDTSSSFSMTMSPPHTSSGTITPHEEEITISPLHRYQQDITTSPIHHHRVMSSLMLGMSTHQAQPPQKDEFAVVVGRSAQISVG